jgi:hypothetical protein
MGHRQPGLGEGGGGAEIEARHETGSREKAGEYLTECQNVAGHAPRYPFPVPRFRFARGCAAS